MLEDGVTISLPDYSEQEIRQGLAVTRDTGRYYTDYDWSRDLILPSDWSRHAILSSDWIGGM